METHTDDRQASNSQLIFVPHKDTIRLLKVYVHRSLSLNDKTLEQEGKRAGRKEKWVTIPRAMRRHSSDTFLHCGGDGTGVPVASGPPASQPETPPEEPQKPTKKPKKSKKPSLWKRVVGFFSKRSKDEEDGPAEIPEASQAERTSDTTATCLPTSPVTLRKRESVRKTSIKRRISRRMSFTRLNRLSKDLSAADITHVEDVVSVEPTYSYYEKVSEELEKIVHEVQEIEEAKPLSHEEIVNRIIALVKEEGDAIDSKLRDDPTLSNFFQSISYLSFQKLADAYVETEALPIHNPPIVFPTATELVKLAFTYDFTAKIAGLARPNTDYITRLGCRYLQDRFEYNQACADHPDYDSDS